MGIYRLILSIEILIFHTSNCLGVIGYSAVFAFYIMSGYTITYVLEKIYYDKNIKAYYLNRLLKIWPAYIGVCVISFIIYYFCGNSVTVNGSEEKLFLAALDNYTFGDIIHELTFNFMKSYNNMFLVFNGFPTLVTQAWTNCVEIVFYMLAPLYVYLHRNHKSVYRIIFVISIMIPIITYLRGMDFPTYRYRSVMGTMFLFMLGGQLFYHRTSLIKIKYPMVLFFLINILYLLYFAFGKNKAVLSDFKIYFSVLLEIIIIVCALQMISGKNKKIDLLCAEFSMGIYLTQKVARAIVIYGCYLLSWGGIINTFWFVVFNLVLAIGLSMIFVKVLNRPLEKIRQRIKEKML